MVNAAIARVGEFFHAWRAAWMAERLLQLSTTLVIKLIGGFDAAPVNDDWDKARFVCS